MHTHCEPVTYDAPVGSRWTCPECGTTFVMKSPENMPEHVRRLPGVLDRSFWDVEVAAGDYGTPMDEVFAELDAEEVANANEQRNRSE